MVITSKSPLVSSQRQFDSIYFDLSGAIALVLRPILLPEPCAYGPSGGYVKLFRINFTNRQPSARILDIYIYIFIYLRFKFLSEVL